MCECVRGINVYFGICCMCVCVCVYVCVCARANACVELTFVLLFVCVRFKGLFLRMAFLSMTNICSEFFFCELLCCLWFYYYNCCYYCCYYDYHIPEFNGRSNVVYHIKRINDREKYDLLCYVTLTNKVVFKYQAFYFSYVHIFIHSTQMWTSG